MSTRCMTAKKARRAFTLIELLVAMTLTLFVMVILTEAFTKGLDTFSGLKSIGDMQENLRVATSNVRADLEQDHLNGKRRLSDPHHWTERPRSGFLRVFHGSNPSNNRLARYVNEGPANFVESFRATDHIIHMVVKRKGNRLEDFFSAPAPPELLALKTDIFGSARDATLRDNTTFRSQWAEVAYFLVPAGTTADPLDNAPNAGGQGTALTTYKLYRLELLIVPDNGAVNNQGFNEDPLARFKNIACKRMPDGKLYFPSPDDYINPVNRVFDPALAATFQARASLVMTDVLSFHVQCQFHVPTQEALVSDGSRTTITDFTFPTFKDPVNRNFDSATVYKETINLGNDGRTAQVDAVLRGLSISVRTWDRGRGQARQVTLIQDL